MVTLISPMITASSFQGKTPVELDEENQEKDKGEKQQLLILWARLAEILRIQKALALWTWFSKGLRLWPLSQSLRTTTSSYDFFLIIFYGFFLEEVVWDMLEYLAGKEMFSFSIKPIPGKFSLGLVWFTLY